PAPTRSAASCSGAASRCSTPRPASTGASPSRKRTERGARLAWALALPARRRLFGLAAFRTGGLSAWRLFGPAAFRPGGFSAQRPVGTAVCRPGGLPARRLFAPAAFRPGGFSARRLFGPAAFRPGGFSARRLFAWRLLVRRVLAQVGEDDLVEA